MAIIIEKQPLIEPWLDKDDPASIAIDDPRIKRSHFEKLMLKLGQIITATDMNLMDLSAGRVSALMRRYEEELGSSDSAHDIKMSFEGRDGEYRGGGIYVTWCRRDRDCYWKNGPLKITFKKVNGT